MTFMSGFQVRAWRAVTRAAVGAGPGMKVLDLAAGTGTSTNDYALTGAQVVACDFSIGMMQEQRRYPDLQLWLGMPPLCLLPTTLLTWSLSLTACAM